MSSLSLETWVWIGVGVDAVLAVVVGVLLVLWRTRVRDRKLEKRRVLHVRRYLQRGYLSRTVAPPPLQMEVERPPPSRHSSQHPSRQPSQHPSRQPSRSGTQRQHVQHVHPVIRQTVVRESRQITSTSGSTNDVEGLPEFAFLDETLANAGPTSPTSLTSQTGHVTPVGGGRPFSELQHQVHENGDTYSTPLDERVVRNPLAVETDAQRAENVAVTTYYTYASPVDDDNNREEQAAHSPRSVQLEQDSSVQERQDGAVVPHYVNVPHTESTVQESSAGYNQVVVETVHTSQTVSYVNVTPASDEPEDSSDRDFPADDDEVAMGTAVVAMTPPTEESPDEEFPTPRSENAERVSESSLAEHRSSPLHVTQRSHVYEEIAYVDTDVTSGEQEDTMTMAFDGDEEPEEIMTLQTVDTTDVM